MKALAILHQLIPVIRGLEKKFFFRLHCYNMGFTAVANQQRHCVLTVKVMLSCTQFNPDVVILRHRFKDGMMPVSARPTDTSMSFNRYHVSG